MKIDRHGQAKVLTQSEIQLLFSQGLQTSRDREHKHPGNLSRMLAICFAILAMRSRFGRAELLGLRVRSQVKLMPVTKISYRLDR